jgi:hypothetical protein
MTAVDQCRGATAVEVERIRGAQFDHKISKLAERETGVEAAASAITDHHQQIPVRQPEGGTRIAPLRDVGIKLGCPATNPSGSALRSTG